MLKDKWNCHSLLFFVSWIGPFLGSLSKMKLWAVLAVCILLSSSVSNTPLPSHWLAGKKRSSQESQLEDEDTAFGMYEAAPERPTAVLGQQDVQNHCEYFNFIMFFNQDTRIFGCLEFQKHSNVLFLQNPLT